MITSLTRDFSRTATAPFVVTTLTGRRIRLSQTFAGRIACHTTPSHHGRSTRREVICVLSLRVEGVEGEDAPSSTPETLAGELRDTARAVGTVALAPGRFLADNSADVCYGDRHATLFLRSRVFARSREEAEHLAGHCSEILGRAPEEAVAAFCRATEKRAQEHAAEVEAAEVGQAVHDLVAEAAEEAAAWIGYEDKLAALREELKAHTIALAEGKAKAHARCADVLPYVRREARARGESYGRPFAPASTVRLTAEALKAERSRSLAQAGEATS